MRTLTVPQNGRSGSTTVETAAESKEHYVNVYSTSNLGVFGLLLPPNSFTGVSLGESVSDAISIILKHFSFTSLNIMAGVAGRLVGTQASGYAVKQKLKEVEIRTIIKAFKKPKVGPRSPLDPKDGAFTILGLNPSKTLTEEETLAPSAITYSGNPSLDLSALLKALFAIGAVTQDERSLLSSISAALGGSLGLSFGSEDTPKVRHRIARKAWIASPSEFAWYYHSVNDHKAEGLLNGTAFLQINKDVDELDVRTEIRADWGKNADFENVFEETLRVIHPPVPKTPILSDLTSSDRMPIVLPRHDVSKLLGISNEELQSLLDDPSEKGLRAFGAKQKYVTKGSLARLLEI